MFIELEELDVPEQKDFLFPFSQKSIQRLRRIWSIFYIELSKRFRLSFKPLFVRQVPMGAILAMEVVDAVVGAAVDVTRYVLLPKKIMIISSVSLVPVTIRKS
jgi:hypothetical protein